VTFHKHKNPSYCITSYFTLCCSQLVHRDLAARNVLMAAGKICKISDFGLTIDEHEGDKHCSATKRRGKFTHRYFYTMYSIHLCFMVLSFFLNFLATVSVMKIYYLLYIHGIYKKNTAMWGSEEGSNLNSSATDKRFIFITKFFN
jgi:serine/threonine protein kinase